MARLEVVLGNKLEGVYLTGSEALTYQRVLQACRAWAYTRGDLLLAKGPAARWALAHGSDHTLIDTAVAIRNGLPPGPLERERVESLAMIARAEVHTALAAEEGHGG